jgi:hypothetical protein
MKLKPEFTAEPTAGQNETSSQDTGKDLQLVYRRVRHSGFARGENTMAELEGKARREGERKSRAGVSTKTLARKRARA